MGCMTSCQLESRPTVRPALTTAPDATAGADVIVVRGLVKRSGERRIVDDVSWSVARGELFGLLGTNGAGKTTTVEILQGLRRRDAGAVEVLGLDPEVAGDRLRRRIGAQLQDSALPDRMRVGEALALFSSLHPDPRPMSEIEDEWDLGRLRKQPFAKLSGGERQRLFVALALVGRPELVFLDELTQNLDPAARRRTWDVVRRIRATGTTVVLVTHDVEEAESLCDRLVVMDRGRVVAAGTPTQIIERFGAEVTVRFADPGLSPVTLDALRGLPGAAVDQRATEITVTGPGVLAAQIGHLLVDAGHVPHDLRVDRPTLDDHFVALTTGARS